MEKSGAGLVRASGIWDGLQFLRFPPLHIFPDGIALGSGWPSKMVANFYGLYFDRDRCLFNLRALVRLPIPHRPLGNMI